MYLVWSDAIVGTVCDCCRMRGWNQSVIQNNMSVIHQSPRPHHKLYLTQIDLWRALPSITRVEFYLDWSQWCIFGLSVSLEHRPMLYPLCLLILLSIHSIQRSPRSLYSIQGLMIPYLDFPNANRKELICHVTVITNRNMDGYLISNMLTKLILEIRTFRVSIEQQKSNYLKLKRKIFHNPICQQSVRRASSGKIVFFT